MRLLMRLVLLSTAIVLLFFSLYHFSKSQSIYGFWCLIIGYCCVKLYVYGRKMNNQQPILQQLKQIRDQLFSYDQKLLNTEVSSVGNDVCTCLNCGHEYQGLYCPKCGQDRREDKISWTQLLTEVINFDNKFIRTLYGLIRCPGEMLHSYISGHHARYCGPIRFVFFAAIVLAIASFIAYSDSIRNIQTSAFNGDMVLFQCAIAFLVDFIPLYFAFRWTREGKKLRSADFYSIVLYFIGIDFLIRSVFYILPIGAQCSQNLRMGIMICYQFYVLKDFFYLSFWQTFGLYVIRCVLYLLCAIITLIPIYFAEVVINIQHEHNTACASSQERSFTEEYQRTEKAFTFITGGVFEKWINNMEKRKKDRHAQEDIKRADDVIARTEKLLRDLENS